MIFALLKPTIAEPIVGLLVKNCSERTIQNLKELLKSGYLIKTTLNTSLTKS